MFSQTCRQIHPLLSYLKRKGIDSERNATRWKFSFPRANKLVNTISVDAVVADAFCFSCSALWMPEHTVVEEGSRAASFDRDVHYVVYFESSLLFPMMICVFLFSRGELVLV